MPSTIKAKLRAIFEKMSAAEAAAQQGEWKQTEEALIAAAGRIGEALREISRKRGSPG
jgi:hypothetical protein